MDTAQRIIDRIAVRLEDPNQRFFSTSDLVLAYNDALDELSDATEVNENYVTIKRRKWAVYSDLRGYLPPDALRVTAVWNPLTSLWLSPVTVRELDDSVGRKWEGRTESSRWWWMRGLYFLGAYPTAADDTSPLRVHYSCLLPHVEESGGLATGLTTSVEIPPDLGAGAIEHYMMYSLLVQKKESQKALEYWSRYEKDQEELKKLTQQRMMRDKIPHMGARRK